MGVRTGGNQVVWEGDGGECSCFSSESRVCWGVGSQEGGKCAKMGKEELEKGRVCWNVRFMEIWMLGWLVCFSKIQTPVIQDCGFRNYPTMTLSLHVNGQLPQMVKRAEKSQKSVPRSGYELARFLKSFRRRYGDSMALCGCMEVWGGGLESFFLKNSFIKI